MDNAKRHINPSATPVDGRVWSCKQCLQVEGSEADFATHLRTHLKGHRARAIRNSGKSNNNEAHSKKLSAGAVLKLDFPAELGDSFLHDRDNTCRLVDPALAMPSKRCFQMLDPDDDLMSLELNGYPAINENVNATNSNMVAAPNVTKSSKNGGKVIDINGQIVEAPEGGEDTGDGMLVCEICEKTFKTSAYLYRHLRKHIGEFSCKDCSQTFARKETWLTHRCAEKIKAENDSTQSTPSLRLVSETKEDKMETFSNPDEIFKVSCTVEAPQDSKRRCLVCSTVLSDANSLKKHMLTHDRAACYTCVYCCACMQHRHSIRRHLRLYHPEYEDEWNNQDFITSLQTETRKRHPGGCRKSKAPSTKKKKTLDTDFKIPAHRPKKDSLLGVGMAEDIRLELDCHLSQSAKSAFPETTEYLANDRTNKDDTLDLISGFSSHFDEAMSQMSFQALSLPDLLASPSKDKFDSTSSNNAFSINSDAKTNCHIFAELAKSTLADSITKTPVKNGGAESMFVMYECGKNRNDVKKNCDIFAEIDKLADADTLGKTSVTNCESMFVMYECDKNHADELGRHNNVNHGDLQKCGGLKSLFGQVSVGEDLLAGVDAKVVEDLAELCGGGGCCESEAESGEMPSMPVIFCDEIEIEALARADDINTGVEILLCPQQEPLDYCSSLLLEEAPAQELAPMQLIDTSNDFSFFVLG